MPRTEIQELLIRLETLQQRLDKSDTLEEKRLLLEQFRGLLTEAINLFAKN